MKKKAVFTSQGVVLTSEDGSYEIHSNDKVRYFNKNGECEGAVSVDGRGYVNGISVDGGRTFVSVIDRRELMSMTVESGFEITCVKCGSGDVWFDTGGSGFDAELECRNCGNNYWENYGI
ncbi:hypothetical protein J26TS2_00680 [Shouchella clausii]|nr:hypothetical protein J26TS2_00680 [Shouchella clausii]